MQDFICISILRFFGDLNDPRQMAKVLYPLQEIVLVAMCAAICGADTFVEMEGFGKAKLDFLKRFLPFKNGIPSHDTFGAVFANLDARQFNEIFVKWVLSFQKSLPNHVAIDGKTVRGSKNGVVPPVHIVSAWSSDQRLVIGQLKTEKKSNEIKAIPELLSMLSLKGALITIDAMGCQKDIAEKILRYALEISPAAKARLALGEFRWRLCRQGCRCGGKFHFTSTVVDKRADYLLAVKKNQKSLFENIKTVFEAAESGTWPMELPERQTTDKNHGRMENRIYSLITQPELLATLGEWRKLSCIGKVKRICVQGAKSTEETRYFISSRKLDIETFSDTVRNHWGIENSLHWVLDIVFRDDESRAREKNAAANFVTLKHITLNMLKSLQGKQSMRVRRKLAGWDEEYLYKALCATPA